MVTGCTFHLHRAISLYRNIFIYDKKWICLVWLFLFWEHIFNACYRSVDESAQSNKNKNDTSTFVQRIIKRIKLRKYQLRHSYLIVLQISFFWVIFLTIKQIIFRFFPPISGSWLFSCFGWKKFHCMFQSKKIFILVGPSHALLEGYPCPRVVLVQKATVPVPQLVPVSPNLVPVPQTALDCHRQLRTLSCPSRPIRIRKQHLVFKPIGG